MNTYNEIRSKIRKFLETSGISPYDLVRVAKDMCCCGQCEMFVQHYSKDGQPLDFGHCRKNNNPSPRRPHQQSCGFWTEQEDFINAD